MKKVFLSVLIFVGLTTFAQEKRDQVGKREKMTPEQQTELHVKKMKLDLDLNENQVAEIKKIVARQNAKRDSKKTEMQAKRAEGKKPTADEIFKMKNEMLDEQIAHKAEMKKILNAEQFSKWETIKSERKKGFVKKARKERKERKIEDIEK